jgi:hypothetical protein
LQQTFRYETRTAAPIHLVGELTDVLFGREHTPFAACQGRFRLVERCQELSALPLTLLPQPKSFLDRIFRTVQPSRFDGLPHKRFLIGR